MTLLDSLHEAYNHPKAEPKKCKVEMELDRKDADGPERTFLDNLLYHYSPTDAKYVNTTALAQALRSAHMDISDKTLERHRKKQCVCFKSGAKS